ncbi:hypothetical protein HOK51_09795 [Candidatus Woesearchaeota archaeon]|nr:hypothetical protein [Candidatus Woesearchaeota archaeon]MBT6520116.1 hypothetical protein [Candidatus Woesearchaeota archaeon]MBT7366721.1 hypothetical protein [Candidatus Woesearchaeota archaeon]
MSKSIKKNKNNNSNKSNSEKPKTVSIHKLDKGYSLDRTSYTYRKVSEHYLITEYEVSPYELDGGITFDNVVEILSKDKGTRFVDHRCLELIVNGFNLSSDDKNVVLRDFKNKTTTTLIIKNKKVTKKRKTKKEKEFEKNKAKLEDLLKNIYSKLACIQKIEKIYEQSDEYVLIIDTDNGYATTKLNKYNKYPLLPNNMSLSTNGTYNSISCEEQFGKYVFTRNVTEDEVAVSGRCGFTQTVGIEDYMRPDALKKKCFDLLCNYLPIQNPLTIKKNKKQQIDFWIYNKELDSWAKFMPLPNITDN